MNLRIRFVFWFAVCVAIILSITFSVIYNRSARFRKEEFFERLQQKALTTHRMWFDVQEIDSTMLKIIDRNTLTSLYQECVIMVNESNRLIYSSIDDDSVRLDFSMIDRVRHAGKVEYTDPVTKVETYGLIMILNGHPNLVMASAYDIYGFRKLNNLLSILVFTWFMGLILTIGVAYLYVRNIVGRPLSNLKDQIASIGENDLTRRIIVPPNQNELTILAQSFNALLQRLEQAFQAQHHFVQFASHELRTPLANMMSVTENSLSKERTPEVYKATLASLKEEQSRLIEMTNSLLLLSRFRNTQLTESTPEIRIDEVLYQAMDDVKALMPEYRTMLGFSGFPINENHLMVQGNAALLRTAFRNLLENACRYANDHSVKIQIETREREMELYFDNLGPTLSEAEQSYLFTPFFRGENASQKRGYGLGLVIAQRIFEIHGATLKYLNPSPGLNRFVVNFT